MHFAEQSVPVGQGAGLTGR